MWYHRGPMNEKLLQPISKKITERPWLHCQCWGDVYHQASENRSLTHTKHFRNNVNIVKTTASKEFSEIRLHLVLKGTPTK